MLEKKAEESKFRIDWLLLCDVFNCATSIMHPSHVYIHSPVSRCDTASGATMNLHDSVARKLPMNNPTRISIADEPRATNNGPIANSVPAV